MFISAPRAERISEDAKVLAGEPRAGKVVAVRQGPALATGFHPSSITCGSAEISAI